ncbi:MAG: thiolase family protein [Gammaproteobacteria bacterium]
MTDFELMNKAAIVGVGTSDYGALYRDRQARHDSRLLGVDALRAALDDAGLAISDVDGLICSGVTAHPQRYPDFAYRAGLREVRYLVPYVQSGRLCGAIIAHAAMTVHAGLADCVACVFSITARSSQERFGAGGELYDPLFGMASPGAQYAMLYNRYLDRFGLRGREHLQAAVPIAFRRHAALNPHAALRDPVTVDDYLRSPYVARPLRKLDYCMISDGAACVLVTRADRARDLRKPPVYVTAFSNHATLWEMYVPPEEPKAYYFSYAERMMAEIRARSGLGNADIDSFQVYDNFTPDVLWSLEGAGFCAQGEALDWIQGGRIELGGELPMNTSGGMMSEAYLQGWNNIAEAARQIRGECGPRQVAGCRTVLYACLAGVSNMVLFSGQ